MSRPVHKVDDGPHAREAAEWVIRRDGGMTLAEERKLQAWLAGDPRRRAAYERRLKEWNMLSAASLLRGEVDLPPRVETNRTRRGRWAAPVVAAGILAAACVVLLMAPRTRQPGEPAAPVADVASAAVQERRVLADGSIIDLGEGAAVEVAFTPERRTVRLLRGSAHFMVAHDAHRPFVVDVAERFAIRAVGTAFHVSLSSVGIDVRVTEGRVQVETRTEAAGLPAFPELQVGQRLQAPLSLESGGVVLGSFDLPSVTVPDQPRRFEFEAAPLGLVMAEINRLGGVRIVIEDPELLEIPIYASLTGRNAETLVGLLEATGVLKVERASGMIRVLRAAPPP